MLPPFIQFLFFSFPSAFDVSGAGLARLLFSELKKCGVTSCVMKNCVGLCGDGQYLNNNVAKELERQNFLQGLFNVCRLDPGVVISLH